MFSLCPGFNVYSSLENVSNVSYDYECIDTNSLI